MIVRWKKKRKKRSHKRSRKNPTRTGTSKKRPLRRILRSGPNSNDRQSLYKSRVFGDLVKTI
ncbi:hypothetical protein DLM76_02345 [Leptospira yasudae]|nr:hypothetical protein DLM76_02345 [Leptospira yasudae]TGK29645.1 hypothetical protein EHQ05_01365 [Leptospira yasudae]TGM07729.1 hypothetical protein EHQ86_06650 [Leptospira yasudae]